MRVLLSDGSGLTAKQTSYQLGRQGHHVEVLAPKGLSLARYTRYVREIHPVAPYGPDPLGWLEQMLGVWSAGHFDMLIATQEQVAVLALCPDRLAAAGVISAIPSFGSLVRVQDKVSAFATLEHLGIRQPTGQIIHDAEALGSYGPLPCFVKTPIGTGSSGVRLIHTRQQARALATMCEGDGVFDRGPVLVQAPVTGPLIMVQSIFERGRLVAFHACHRRSEGVSGGASRKRSVLLPEAEALMAILGRSLDWHGALSADLIVGKEGPSVIDVNPRLVEPANAYASGVDLLASLIDTARAFAAPTEGECPAIGRAGTNTHQLLLAVLGAAAGGRRGPIAAELIAGVVRRGRYADSVEELSPLRHDLIAAVPVLAASIATLISPSTYSWFTDGSIANYALTPSGWEDLVRASLTMPARSGSAGPGWPR